MTKYKVGDVAALFSKPKSPTTTGGKKLQSLFEDYYSKKGKHTFYSQEENSENNKHEEGQEMNDQSVSKKSRKRKLSLSNDSELNENHSSKRFKESAEQKIYSKNKKQKFLKKHKHFAEKNSDLKPIVFTKKFKGSWEQEDDSKNNEEKEIQKFKKQQDFPRKIKKPKENSFNSSSVFPKFEAENDSENDKESPSVSKLKDIQKDIPQSKSFIKKSKKKLKLDENNSQLLLDTSCKDSVDSGDTSLKKAMEDNSQNKSFIKKSKKKQKLDENNSKLLLDTSCKDSVDSDDASLKRTMKDNPQNKNFSKKSKKKQKLDQNNSRLFHDTSCKDSVDSDDASLKKEVEEFMNNNSEKMERNYDTIKEKESFNWYKKDTLGKPKKKFLKQENISSPKYEKSPEQNVKSQKNNRNAQDSSKTKSKDNFDKTESKMNFNDIKQNSPIKKQNSLEHDNVKKSKKTKHDLNVTNVNSFLTSENNSEFNIPEAKGIVDFKRKPKNKNNDGVNAFKNFKNEDFNIGNKLQKGQGKEVEVKALDFIKLHEDNEKSNEEKLSRTLFVGNLPKNISKQELRNVFTSFGIVETVRLPGIETDKAKIFNKNPPKLLHSNYASDTVPGFVMFKDRQSAVNALKLSGSVFKGHHITVDFALPAGSHKLYDNKRSIFIGNLPFNVKDESIWNAFNHCGRIECVRVVRDRQTGLGKGFGYVLFSTVEAKQNALDLETLNIEGREIRIKAVDSNKKTQKADISSSKRDTFKSRAIRMKKNNQDTGGHKSIRKLTNKQKMLHKKKKTAEILLKAMK